MTTVEWSGLIAGQQVVLAARMSGASRLLGILQPWVLSWVAFDLDGRLVNVSPYQLRAILPELRAIFEEAKAWDSRSQTRC